MYIFCHCLSHYYLATVTYCKWSVKEGQQEKIVLNKVQINCESSLACSNLLQWRNQEKGLTSAIL